VPAGEHTVVAKNPGLGTQKRSVQVAGGATRLVEIDLGRAAR
jgi:hypothetical protein